MGFSDIDDEVEFNSSLVVRENIDEEKLEFILKKLTGQKRELLNFIVSMESKQSEGLTKKMTYCDIQESTSISRKSCGEVIKRLIETELISRYETIVGRQGGVIFILSDYIKQNKNILLTKKKKKRKK